MRESNRIFLGKRSERGAALYIVAGSMVVLLGISALAIDLVNFYLARAQAQRAADAGALAGAKEFIDSACTSGGVNCSTLVGPGAAATSQAVGVASQNPVAGLAPSSSTVTTTYNCANTASNGDCEEPQIGVTVYRDTTHGNPLPTYFGKIFGITTVNVSATAWAEAYNPSGTAGVSVGVECIRPFLVPNCDPNHPVAVGTAEANPNCACQGTGLPGDCPAGFGAGYDMENYFDPSTKAIVNPGDCNWSTSSMRCTGPGVIGAYWALHQDAAPSQWYTIAFTVQGASQYEQNIYTCAPQAVACNTSLNSLNGKKVGPTDQGVETLIHASGLGLNQGQDEMCAATAPYCLGTPPFTITGGTNNPYGLAGDNFTSPSDSITNIVVFSGQLAPGGGAANPGNVTVVGYMQLFIQDVIHNGTADYMETIVMNLGGCGNTSSSSNPPPVTSQGGSFIPIRLIHQ